ncbi:MAG TPA: MFS transporter [Actinophytocola sp.]|uniref:MFS transporter n=1 Tax=Actinophytocola sp. TaxID=1872138 RepID=UPI002F93D141
MSPTAPAEAPGELARIREVLAIRPFRRLWLVLGISSLGDWMGLLAVSTFAASEVSGTVAKGLAFGGVMAVRLLPALLLGPVAGVVADRFDRRLVLVLCDLTRFVLFASIPTVGLLVAAPAVVVGWATFATFLIEAVGMVWSPAKEAAVPNLVPAGRLETANQLSLATSFGITPVLGGLLIAGLDGLVVLFGSAIPSWLHASDIALYFNAATFLANALVVWYAIREISGRNGHPQSAGALRTLLDGWSYVGHTRLVRGLTVGILVAFCGAGAVIGTAMFYARSLGGANATFELLFGALFAGFAVGIASGPVLVHDLSRRRWFGVSIALTGYSVALLAPAPHLAVALPVCFAAGAGAGMALLCGMTLLGGEVGDEVRGRVFAFVQTGARVVLLASIFVSSVLVGIGGSHWVRLGDVAFSVSTARVILLAVGIAMATAGALTLRQIDDRAGVPLLADLRAALRGRKR